MSMMAKTRSISQADIRSRLNTDTACITNARHLASYNWIEAASPTIAIPGCPARWNNINTTRQLQKDQGLVYIAQNAARHPASPLEPLFRALWTENPSYDIQKVDFVSDRNNIRKLLAFVDSTTSKKSYEDFAISAEQIGNTTVLCRTETETTQFIKPNEFFGYGHEFEKAYTTQEVDRSTGHHRVTTYEFQGRQYVIRYEADGYQSETNMHTSDENESKDLDEQLSSLLDKVSLKTSPEATSTASNDVHSRLVIKSEGRTIPSSSLLEIKTRVVYKPIPFEEVAAQLWISQTPRLVRAYHKNGSFSIPKVEDVSKNIADWEKHKQPSLKLLASLMSLIAHNVKELGRAVIRYKANEDKLVIEQATITPFLPPDLYLKWKKPNASAKDDAAADAAIPSAKEIVEKEPSHATGQAKPGSSKDKSGRQRKASDK